MDEYDPISLMFCGMEKLGPGDNAHTLQVLQVLPKRQFGVIVDAGCGTGRQTLALAKQLGTPIHAVDSHQPFLDELVRRAEEGHVGRLVRTHHMEMTDIPQTFQGIDLLWSEGAAYSIGFPRALAEWAPALAPGGFLVVSELSWLTEQPPDPVREFFRTGYPAMQSVSQNTDVATGAGYRMLTTSTLPQWAWVDGYYDLLAPRAKVLLDHPSPPVRELAAEMIREIEIFACSADSYGYVFYVLQRAEPVAATDTGRRHGFVVGGR